MGAETELNRTLEKKYFNRYKQVETHISKYAFTNQFCPYDVKFFSGATHYGIAEIKIRKYDLTFFSKYPPYLEYIKLEGLLNEKEKIKQTTGIEVQPYLFHCTKDGFIQLYTLSGLTDYDYTYAYLPIDDQHPKIKVKKKVTELKHAPTQLIDLRRKK